MSPYRKLLVLLSSDAETDAALSRGIWLAKVSGAELVVKLFAAPESRRPGLHDPALIEQMEKRSREGRQRWLDDNLQGLRDQGIRASGQVVRGEPVREAMLAAILEVEPDLAIKSVHHESAIRRLFFTPDDWYLARLSPLPLLVVAAGADRPPTRILVAVDPSSQTDSPTLDDRIVAAASALALQGQAELHLAYVSEPIAEVMADANMVGGVTTMGLVDQVEDERKTSFKAFADRFGVPETARHFLHGRVDLALGELADQLGAGVIAAGSNYRSGMERFLLGSTTEDLLAHARQDILVVKPQGFSDRLAEAAGFGRTS